MASEYDSIDQVFHQPTRLAIVSELCSAQSELPFNTLREKLALTDGNLSRHLQALHDKGIIGIRKTFVDAKPRTTISLTSRGRDDFLRYLDNLESVLKKAWRATRTQRERVDLRPSSLRTSKA